MNYKLQCVSVNVLGILGAVLWGIHWIIPFLFFGSDGYEFFIFMFFVGFFISFGISWKLSKYYLYVEINDDIISVYTDKNFFTNIEYFEFRTNEIKDFFHKTGKGFFDYFSLATSNRERIVINHYPKNNEIDNYLDLINYLESVYIETKEVITIEEERLEEALIESNSGGLYLFLAIIALIGSVVVFFEFRKNEFWDNSQAILSFIGAVILLMKYFSTRLPKSRLKIRDKENKRKLKKKIKKQNKNH